MGRSPPPGAPRIIPARAGFTQSALASAVSHPGSSPLARGLPTENWNQLADARIIPARAGFTYRRVPGGSSRRDHPRSRGVYGPAHAAGGGGHGSSPLARGLLLLPHIAEHGRRIIPARAGFTLDGLDAGLRHEDHPRSRGVYVLTLIVNSIALGSSPLARGLPLVRPDGQGQGRIIPARAGFTWPPPASPSRSRDHPRSRGVYAVVGGVYGPAAGSSPLARGLLAQKGGLPPVGGIIPARAGFTLGRQAGPAGRPDHPRSRGVYVPARLAPYVVGGSSPLARGLPSGSRSCEPDRRIIPARAGFTCSGGAG